jgi:hypothetical protein
MPAPVAGPSPTAVPTATKAPSAPTLTTGLANGGFEEADDEGRPIGWRKYGGELIRSSAARWEGQFAAAFISRTTSTKWAFQTVAVEGGKAYVLSGYALKNDANIEASYLRLSWYASPDGSGRAIDSVDSTTRLTDDSPDFRFLTTGPVAAPAEAGSAKVRLMLDPVSEAEGKVYFDAISFEETIMPPPTQTAVPSPLAEETATPPEAAQTPLSPPSGDRESFTPPAPGEQSDSSPSPSASRPSPTVLSATPGRSEVAASSRDESSQSELGLTRTPVILYRERRTAQSAQGEEGVAAGGDQGDGLSPIVLVLATALPALVAVGAGSYLWWRAKRARPP